MKCAAYVVGKRFCCIGVEDTPMGPIPLFSFVDIPPDAPDVPEGPVGEDMPEHLQPIAGLAIEGINKSLQNNKLSGAVESVVTRARENDQNAMAILSLVGKRARAGHPRASMVAQLVQRYIRSHPYRRIEIGSEPKTEVAKSPLLRAIVSQSKGPGYALCLAVQLPSAPRTMATVMTLAHGPALTEQFVFDVAGCMSDEDSVLFLTGVERSHDDSLLAHAQTLPKNEGELIVAGRLVGMARTVQAVSAGQWPEKAMGKDVAWELGS